VALHQILENTLTKSPQLLFGALALAWFTCGCDNIGNAPAGMSNQQAADAIAKMSPEDRIRFIASSPASPAQKAAKYKKVEEETGVKAADVLKDSVRMPGSN